MQRKGTFSKWKSFHYTLENGFLMEFKRDNLNKPLEVIRLDECEVKEGKLLTGESNSLAIFAPKKNPIFLRTATHSSMIEWLSALGSHCSKEIIFESSLANAFNDPVTVVSSGGIILEVNEKFADLFGYQKNDMIGRNIKIIVPPNIASKHDEYIKNYDPNRESKLLGKIRSMEALHANGHLFPILLSLGVDTSKEGEVRFIGTIRPDKSSVFTQESLTNFVSKNVQEVMEEASKNLKENLEKELRLLLDELDEYKLKYNRLIQEQRNSGPIKFTGNTSNTNNRGSTGTGTSSNSNSGTFDFGSSGKELSLDTSKIEIQEKIGVGGSGMVVYSAIVDGWKCAVKELDLSNAKEKEIELFESEVSVMERLPFHKNIERILFHTRSNNTLRIFMTQYKETLGMKLSSLQTQKKYFSLEKIIKLSLDILKGLMFLHEREIIHRDIKSDNIFINYNSSGEISYVSIGDFDRAKIVSGGSRAKTTVGTTCWLAPEVLNSDNVKEYTYSIDIWSLGMVMFEMMTNHKPYFNESQMDILKLITQGKSPSFPKDFSQSQQKMVAPLLPLWERCLEVDPKKRITLPELKEQLLHLL